MSEHLGDNEPRERRKLVQLCRTRKEAPGRAVLATSGRDLQSRRVAGKPDASLLRGWRSSRRRRARVKAPRRKEPPKAAGWAGTVGNTAGTPEEAAEPRSHPKQQGLGRAFEAAPPCLFPKIHLFT